MTPKDKLASALEALDHARRTLEELEAIATGDGEIDDVVNDAAEMIEAEVARMSHFHLQCV